MKLNQYYLDIVYRMFDQLRYIINNIRCSFRCCNKSEPESEPDTPAPHHECAPSKKNSAFFPDINASEITTPSINIRRATIPDSNVNEGTPILRKKQSLSVNDISASDLGLRKA